MMTHEIGLDDENIVTILDDTGNDEDVILYWEDDGDMLFMTQQFDDEDDAIISLTATQCMVLKEILNNIIIDDED